MTSDKNKDKNEWQNFLDTGKGGQKAVNKRPANKYKTPRKVSGKQQGALRRNR